MCPKYKFVGLLIIFTVVMAGMLSCAKSTQIPNSADISPIEDVEMEPEKLVAGDILTVLVKGEKSCSGDFSIDEAGKIDFCYVGELLVEGREIQEIASYLQNILAKDYLKTPQVKVSMNSGGISEGLVGNFRILGEVARPGLYKMKKGLSILDAILEAGGFTDFASPNKTRIIRGQGKGKKIIIVRMKDMMKTGDLTENQSLRPGDIIVVPEGIL